MTEQEQQDQEPEMSDDEAIKRISEAMAANA